MGSAAAQTQKAGHGLGERFGADPNSGLRPWGVLRRRPRKQTNLSHGDDLADDDEMPSMTTTTSGRCSDGGTDVARGSAEKKNNFFGRFPTPPGAPGRQECVRGGWLSREPSWPWETRNKKQRLSSGVLGGFRRSPEPVFGNCLGGTRGPRRRRKRAPARASERTQGCFRRRRRKRKWRKRTERGG